VNFIEINRLKRYERNSRVHPDAQVRAIARLIDEVGFVGAFPLRDGVLAKGHGTLSAVELLMSEGKRIYPPPGRAAGAEPFPEGMVPFMDVSGWTEAQFRAFVVADNALGEMSEWDDAMLKMEVNDLLAIGVEIDALGLDATDIEDLNSPGAMAKSFATGAPIEADDGEERVEFRNLSKYPLTVILEADEHERWAALKAKTGMSDKRLLLSLMEDESC